ncbi:hypothetical protein GR268_43640, partial [Rhizobium leguminosarum]|nr:hypothetical protein [Rhizobium leguminosarum]
FIDARDVKQARMVNSAQNVVEASDASVRAAIESDPGQASDPDGALVLSPGAASWPIAAYNQFLVYTRDMNDCSKAKALVDWIYWSQTDSSAAQIARSYVDCTVLCGGGRLLEADPKRWWCCCRANMVVASLAQPAKATLLDQLASGTSGGVQAFSLAGCIYEGTVCFDQGTCVQGSCVCNSNRSGEFCESVKSDSGTPLGTILGAVLGSAIPV